MSKEEKKAIETLKTFESRRRTYCYNTIGYGDVKATEIVLNLIDKQQREIEYYKKQNKNKGIMLNKTLNEVTRSCVGKDKIREKIKEFQKELDEGYLGDDNIRVNKFVIEVLQELLEE